MKCGECIYWSKNTNYQHSINSGVCVELKKTDKIDIYLDLGWDGGSVREIETDEDFGCILFKNM